MESEFRRFNMQLPPHPPLQQYYADEAERRAYLDQAFDVAAQYYDQLSQLIGFGTDRWYRQQALLRAGLAPGMSILDVGCGTGLSSGVAVDIVGPTGRVIGVEPSRGMLGKALSQGRLHAGVRGIAEGLPIQGNQFDFLSMTFALRHVADLQAAFHEFHRVLKPGGILLIVEMTKPDSGLFYQLWRVYMKYIVPFVTRLYSKSRVTRKLYLYCWDTHDQCVPAETILDAMRQVNFHDVKRWVDIGLFSQYTGKKVQQTR